MATIFKAALGMWLAVLLNRKFRLARVTRATVLLPFIVPTVLSTLAWLWMFDATFSVFNWVLRYLWQMQIHPFGIVLKENWGYFKGPLWLGDPGSRESTATVLDVHPVQRGMRIGYRQRAIPADGWVVVVAYTKVPIWISLAVAVSVAAGLYPSVKAARLEPLETLRLG